MAESITIRQSTPADAVPLAELAELDGRRGLSGDVLLAYVDGALRAAVGVFDGRTVADPFHLTDDVVRLLLIRAAQQRAREGERRIFRRLGIGHRLGREGAPA